VPSTRALLHAPWSASKVATALRCPRLFHFRYVDRVREPEVMPETRIGKAIHAALEAVLQGVPIAEATLAARTDLPADHEQARFDRLAGGIEPFTERIAEFRRRRRVRRQLVEYALAVREDLSSTQFYAGDAYYRGILDLAYVFDDALMVTIAVVTLGQRRLQERGGRWLKLLSGAVILVLGALLLFAPQMLVF